MKHLNVLNEMYNLIMALILSEKPDDLEETPVILPVHMESLTLPKNNRNAIQSYFSLHKHKILTLIETELYCK